MNGLPVTNLGQLEHQKMMIQIIIPLIKPIHASRIIFKEERKERGDRIKGNALLYSKISPVHMQGNN